MFAFVRCSLEMFACRERSFHGTIPGDNFISRTIKMNPTGIVVYKRRQPGARPAELAVAKALAREQIEASILALVTIRDDNS